jgi:predicted DNA-binding protein with PD1-like motif
MRSRLLDEVDGLGRYVDIPVDVPVEVSSLIGYLALREAASPQAHIHAVVSERDGTA